MTTDVYTQYFEANCTYNGVERRAALVSLTADSEQGHIVYTAGVAFFPHRDEEDFAVSYDAFASKVLFDGSGRRSKKREAAFLEELHSVIDECASSINASVHWETPLRPARLG